ncbi:ADP-ribosylglycohydrolase family protein [Coraliomargarita algicola]|uniref:ADP-ribosylglycohydrolase family protein n=1 Tax=Coraliomargarita algicola TaxID=3092156 RepID=A0ABZ0RQE4_9BACT|nr:ADP-ribosylglycohydrolase family protein [Coraliomargarita sp. J2-16]WPJ97608.1 ADP-ribosylglycohydrolase family protein [Coraliomargarita sp. J2-16]
MNNEHSASKAPQQNLAATRDPVRDGMLGLLVGDACGVPYEFRDPRDLPPFEQLEMQPPKRFARSYAHVKLGTWSDDGAQALCLYASMRECGMYHAQDYAARLIKWHDRGYMAIDHYVFDIGNQTSAAIGRLKQGTPTRYSGLSGERNNGNGALMRCLPLALLHQGNDVALVYEAHAQARLTHAHIRSQVCCALYCLWARREMQQHTSPWESAIATLRAIYRRDPPALHELDTHIRPERRADGKGTGYVLDSLHSARWACLGPNYETIIKRAISLGNDTDTTACIAGGIAGLRHGAQGIPARWLELLRGKEELKRLGIWHDSSHTPNGLHQHQPSTTHV